MPERALSLSVVVRSSSCFSSSFCLDTPILLKTPSCESLEQNPFSALPRSRSTSEITVENQAIAIMDSEAPGLTWMNSGLSLASDDFAALTSGFGSRRVSACSGLGSTELGYFDKEEFEMLVRQDSQPFIAHCEAEERGVPPPPPPPTATSPVALPKNEASARRPIKEASDFSMDGWLDAPEGIAAFDQGAEMDAPEAYEHEPEDGRLERPQTVDHFVKVEEMFQEDNTSQRLRKRKISAQVEENTAGTTTEPRTKRRRKKADKSRGEHVKERPDMHAWARDAQKGWADKLQEIRNEWQEKKIWQEDHHFGHQITMCTRQHIKSQHECFLRTLQIAKVEGLIEEATFSSSVDDSFCGWISFRVSNVASAEFKNKISSLFSQPYKDNTLNNVFRRAGLIPEQVEENRPGIWADAWNGKTCFQYNCNKRATYSTAQEAVKQWRSGKGGEALGFTN